MPINSSFARVLFCCFYGLVENPEDICNLLVRKNIVRLCLAAMEKAGNLAKMHISCLRLIGFAALSGKK